MDRQNSENNEWKVVENFSKYEIRKNGKVRNRKTKKELKIQYRPNGTPHCCIKNNEGKLKDMSIENLVINAFLPNPDSQKYERIVHLDGNIRNCSLENLVWEENNEAIERYQLEHGMIKPKEYYTFYPLMEFPDSVYEINKVGQIRHKETKKLLKGQLRDSGYLIYTLYINKKIYYRFAHVMVAKQFISNSENKAIVNHIDEDKTNPCVDNLEWVSPSENALYGTAQERGNIGKQKPINEYSINGKYIRTWKSSQLLSEFCEKLFSVENCKGNIRRVILTNSNSQNEKKILFNRVFMQYKGKTDDMIFKISHVSLRKYKTYIFAEDLIVPSKCLYKKKDMVNGHLKVLLNLISRDGKFSRVQKEAIEYAIQCIQQIENDN